LSPGDGSFPFRSAFDKNIVPSLEKYQPDLLILSSGFDGHKNDPTDDGLRLEEPDYGYITDKLIGVADKYCNGRIVSVLEGGYNLPALRKSAKEHVVSLLKKAPSEKLQTEKILPEKLQTENLVPEKLLSEKVTLPTQFQQIPLSLLSQPNLLIPKSTKQPELTKADTTTVLVQSHQVSMVSNESNTSFPLST